MLQISPSLLHPRDRKSHRRRTTPKPPNLRKHKPHPVAPLPSRPQLRASLLVHAFLRIHKSFQLILVTHPPPPHHEMRCAKNPSAKASQQLVGPTDKPPGHSA